MKNLLLALFATVLLLTACNSKTLNQTIVDQRSNKPILYGYCSREAFDKQPYSDWFKKEYDSYTTDADGLKGLSDKSLNDVKIVLVMGTWCSDSRREVPRFYKILDQVKYDAANVEVVCVDSDKQTTVMNVSDIQVTHVPTFIFYKNGKELGRIIEMPQQTLEQDMVAILSK